MRYFVPNWLTVEPESFHLGGLNRLRTRPMTADSRMGPAARRDGAMPPDGPRLSRSRGLQNAIHERGDSFGLMRFFKGMYQLQFWSPITHHGSKFRPTALKPKIPHDKISCTVRYGIPEKLGPVCFRRWNPA